MRMRIVVMMIVIVRTIVMMAIALARSIKE